jgi:hypothetical protein
MQAVDRIARVSALALACCIVLALSGCSSSSSSGGNARVGGATLTRVSELQSNVGRQVTLVGTARHGNSAEDSRLQLRGGAVDLPAYRWPEGYVNQPVSVTATVIDAQAAGGNVSGGTQANPGRAFRIGEVQDVKRWSR